MGERAHIAMAALPKPIEGQWKNQQVRVRAILQVNTEDSYLLGTGLDGETAWLPMSEVKLPGPWDSDDE